MTFQPQVILILGVSAHKQVQRLFIHLLIIDLKQIFTPEDLQRLTNASEGAMYGWANTTDQVLIQRMSMKSPVKGLYHVGHWTWFGTGVTTAIISGWMLGNRLLGNRFTGWVGKVIGRLL